MVGMAVPKSLGNGPKTAVPGNIKNWGYNIYDFQPHLRRKRKIHEDLNPVQIVRHLGFRVQKRGIHRSEIEGGTFFSI